VNLFPRIEVAKPAGQKPADAKPAAPAEAFSLVHLKVATVEAVEDHPNADSLYVLRLKIGGEERTVCAGLKKHLTPVEMRGRKVVVVYNLKPANLRGVESKGMILAAEDAAGKVVPVDPEGAASGDDVTAEGVVPAYKADLTLKEFERAPLAVQSGAVRYKDHPLRSPKGPIKAQAADGTQVR
jgi:methionyl-tRNA synthetase